MPFVSNERIVSFQPRDFAEVDSGKDISKGLLYGYAPWLDNRNLARPQVKSTVAGPAFRSSGEYGVSFGNSSANSYLDTGSGWGMGSASNGSLVMLVYPYTTSGFFFGFKPSGWFVDITASNEPRFWLGGVAAYTCSTTITPNVWQTLAVVWRSGVSSGSQWWLNGKRLGSAFTIGTLSADSGNMFLFARSTDEYAKAFLSGAWCYNRALTDGEAERLSNPLTFWSPLRNIDDSIYFTAGGATFQSAWARGANTVLGVRAA